MRLGNFGPDCCCKSASPAVSLRNIEARLQRTVHRLELRIPGSKGGSMRITYPRTHLLIATTLLLMSGNLAIAGSSDAHPAKSWLDNAVSGKECPSTPVNVPAGGSQFSTSALLNRITISGDKLSIKGTDDPDHIVVSSGGSSSLVDVAWNGRHLGRFGPVKAIELRGHGGDDVLIVKSDVSLPVLIDGGSGDDCVQGGSGADQLLGG